MLENNGDSLEPSGRNGAGAGVVANGFHGAHRTLVASAANGTSKSSTGAVNGSSRNGKEPARSPNTATYENLNREEMTRLLIQALSEMGYKDAAESVGRDSGIDLENPTVASFKNAVLEGAWARAEELVDEATLADTEEDQESSYTNGLVLASSASKDEMRLHIRRQKYLELIQLRRQGDLERALGVLQTELVPLLRDQPETLRPLAGLLMCRDSEELMAQANWDGVQGKSRQTLLSVLSRHISPAVMLPKHRLADLLHQAEEAQLHNCVYHTLPGRPSLYTDHICDKSRFPSECVLELNEHSGEVWKVAFSPDGTKMASCGSDQFVIIWDVPSFKVLHKLTVTGVNDVADDEYNGVLGVGSISWSPDDSMLVTCGRDHYAKIWNVSTGTLKTQLKPFNEPVTSCVWAPGGQAIILGTLSTTDGLCQWSLDGELQFRLSKDQRIEDVAISGDGRWLVAAAFRSKVLIYDYHTRELEADLDLGVRATSLDVCGQSRYVLANRQDGGAMLIDLATRETRAMYSGAKGGDYAIRAEFGGANEAYVISGSEDGHIFIWHKVTGFLVKKMSGHEPRTNCAVWNPKDPCMFASCGDDGKIKVWSNHDFHSKRAGSGWDERWATGIATSTPATSAFPATSGFLAPGSRAF